jgi:hypothetical protein
MPMALADTMDSHHEGLLRALDDLEVLVATSAARDELIPAIEEARRELLAHELTAERLVVAPLRRLHVLDTRQLAVLADELNDLSWDALRLTCGKPEVRGVLSFVRRARAHIERKARTVVPAARSALAEGRLPAVPRWYVDEVYGLQGGRAGPGSEEWLG